MPPHAIQTHVAWTTDSPENRASLQFVPPQATLQMEVGTDDDLAAPSPHDLLDAALASCTALTLRLYAARKGIALRGLRVSVTHETVAGLPHGTPVGDRCRVDGCRAQHIAARGRRLPGAQDIVRGDCDHDRVQALSA